MLEVPKEFEELQWNILSRWNRFDEGWDWNWFIRQFDDDFSELISDMWWEDAVSVIPWEDELLEWIS